MEPMIVLPVPIRTNTPQNPKEKSKIDAKLKSMKSKKCIILIGVKKFILEEVQMLKSTLEDYWSLETSEE